ncbi:MAG TPA: HPr family phosphocarrier protein, partial [Gemmatimonadaceae bacterium]|nr:HPr family phosphocarrier protein [Gemmatimonadaceae bacterium]
MVERLVEIVNKNGIHARPAAEIVKTAGRFKSHIPLAREDLEVNGKSIMGVMMLAAECGSQVQLRADGPDAADAIEALALLIANKFGE